MCRTPGRRRDRRRARSRCARSTVAVNGDLQARARRSRRGDRGTGGVPEPTAESPSRVVPTPQGFVVGRGDRTRLVIWNGRAAKPTFKPPLPFERGVGGAPTLVQNAETLAHVALIACFCLDWFREIGTDEGAGFRAADPVTGAVAMARRLRSADRHAAHRLLSGSREESKRDPSCVSRRRLLRHLGGGWPRRAARALDCRLSGRSALLSARGGIFVLLSFNLRRREIRPRRCGSSRRRAQDSAVTMRARSCRNRDGGSSASRGSNEATPVHNS